MTLDDGEDSEERQAIELAVLLVYFVVARATCGRERQPGCLTIPDNTPRSARLTASQPGQSSDRQTGNNRGSKRKV